MAKELSAEARKKLAAFMAKKIPVYEAQNREKQQGA